ncbi:L-histidine N(alpha)-methyltransferase [Cumulibacter soli]|uniref:L-histidine N(alpha)-methyltransferase n=1 Tax=Cumulibacter soli TaxID=2546344 RepID=UPI00141A0B0D|nr:L-histidine N(alpha)-methyltransferase [Cumulibacter soli]
MIATRIDIELTERQLTESLVADAARGLFAANKVLPPKYFYDRRGSELFEQITELPEYYPTRVERSILDRCARHITATVPQCTSLIELGSGSSSKTPLLLDAMYAQNLDVDYVPIDVSRDALIGAIDVLRELYPRLPIHALLRDFETPLSKLPRYGQRLVALLGGMIGNFDYVQRTRFLRNLTDVLEPREALLLGVDFVKSPDRLIAAYDDAGGVTAEFNRNMLNVLNRLLSAEFDNDQFAHVAQWNAAESRIEMSLQARRSMRVPLRALEAAVTLRCGEAIRTEISTKFRRAEIEREFADAGLRTAGWWSGGENASGAGDDYGLVLGVRCS